MSETSPRRRMRVVLSRMMNFLSVQTNTSVEVSIIVPRLLR